MKCHRITNYRKCLLSSETWYMLLKKALVRCCVVLSHKIFIAIIGPECVHNNFKGKESTAAQRVSFPSTCQMGKVVWCIRKHRRVDAKATALGKLWIIQQPCSSSTKLWALWAFFRHRYVVLVNASLEATKIWPLGKVKGFTSPKAGPSSFWKL